MKEAESEARRGGPPYRAWSALALVGVLAVAAGVRLYALPGQSVVYDEFNSIRYLDAPDVVSFLREQAEYNDEMVPLYFVLQYFWARFTGDSPESLRLLSILIGLVTVAGVFHVAGRLYGPWAALVAGFCLALSPFHLFHSLSIRPYALLTLLGLVSGYTVYRMGRGGEWRWWAANTVVNVLLMWTHVFVFWWLIAQGIYLLIFHPKWFARVAAWTVAHVAALLPLLWFVLQWQVDPPTGELAPLSKLLTFIADRETGRAAYALYMWPDGAPYPGATFFSRPQGQYRFLASLLLLVLYSSLMWLLFRSFQAGVVARGAVWGSDRRTRLETFALLLIWLILPALLLYVFAWTWSHEAFAERYVLYGTPALFILLGGAVAGFRKRAQRVFAAFLLVGFFGVHTAISLSLPLGADYGRVARFLGSRAAPDAEVLYYPPVTRATFDYNLRRVDVSRDWKITGARDLLGLLTPAGKLSAEGRQVWLVVSASHGPLDTSPINSYLDVAGMASERTVFPGANPIFVYRLESAKGGDETVPVAHTPGGAEDIPHTLADAMALEQQGKPVLALDAYREAAGWLVANAAHKEAIAKALYAAGYSGFKGRQNAFEEHLGQAIGGVARLADKAGEPLAGVRAYREAVAALPKSRALHLGLVNALAKRGMVAEALTATEEAQRALPSEGVFALRRGELLYGGGDAEGAVRAYESAIAATPDLAAAYTGLASIQCERGEYRQAVETYGALIARRPDHAMANAGLGEALLKLGQCDKAAKFSSRAVVSEPENPDLLLRLGRTHFECGNGMAGEQACLRAIDVDSGYRPAYEALAAYYAEAKSPGEQAETWREVAARHPSAALPRRYLGESLARAGAPAEAVAQLEAAVAAAPENAEYLCALGNALHAQGEKQRALEAYERAIDLDPGNFVPYDALARICQDEPEQRIAILMRVAAKHPATARPHFEAGRALFETGRSAEAVAELKRAAEADPADAAVHATLGKALLESGQYGAAVAAFSEALRINPEIPDLRALSERAQALEQERALAAEQGGGG